jgi:hypothetical protein
MNTSYKCVYSSHTKKCSVNNAGMLNRFPQQICKAITFDSQEYLVSDLLSGILGEIKGSLRVRKDGTIGCSPQIIMQKVRQLEIVNTMYNTVWFM